MKTASADLIAYLQNAREIYMAELYTFVLRDGTTLRYTSLDVDVTYNGNTYSSTDCLIMRDKIVQTTGMEVGELQVTVFPRAATIWGLPFLAAVRNGALDGAQLTLQRVFYNSWADLFS